jgi:tRNA(Ile)-lysidine synthase
LSRLEAGWLFRALQDTGTYVLAVSGGPDSTALLVLAAQWAADTKATMRFVAVTVDHGLRPESRKEAVAVARLAASLGIEHRTLRWTGVKPKTGLQEAARMARYKLLLSVATEINARHVLTAHTLDDQAETVLMRLCRGSGISGLRGMDMVAPLPVPDRHGVLLVRPFLGVPKARLVATLRAKKVSFARDPSNRDPRFTRVRLRSLMAALAREGLSAERLAGLAERAGRVDDAMFHYLNQAVHAVVSPSLWPDEGPLTLDGKAFRGLPDEISLRLLERVIAFTGNEGPVELAKVEALHAALLGPLDAALLGAKGGAPFRRTLAGAVVTLTGTSIVIERAPPRRTRSGKSAERRIPALTTRKTGPFGAARTR